MSSSLNAVIDDLHVLAEQMVELQQLGDNYEAEKVYSRAKGMACVLREFAADAYRV